MKRKRRFRPGMLVRIAIDCRDGAPATGAVGTYLGRFDTKTGQRYKGSRAGEQGMPKIALEEGGIIWGSECFWLPLQEALKAEREAGVPSVLPRAEREIREFYETFPEGALAAMEAAEEAARKKLEAAYASEG